MILFVWGQSHLDVFVVVRYGYELRQPLAEPHGQIPVHVDGKRFVALLQAADGEVLERAHILAKVHAAHLTHTQTAHWDEPWERQEGASSPPPPPPSSLSSWSSPYHGYHDTFGRSKYGCANVLTLILLFFLKQIPLEFSYSDQ